MPVLALITLALLAFICIGVGAVSAFIEYEERRRARRYAKPRARRTAFRPFIIAGGKPAVVDAPLPPDAPVDDNLPARAAQRHR